MTADSGFDADWRAYLEAVRQQLGVIDFGDLVYLRSTFYVMNDATNLYLAFRVPSTHVARSSFSFKFFDVVTGAWIDTLVINSQLGLFER